MVYRALLVARRELLRKWHYVIYQDYEHFCEIYEIYTVACEIQEVLICFIGSIFLENIALVLAGDAWILQLWKEFVGCPILSGK